MTSSKVAKDYFLLTKNTFKNPRVFRRVYRDSNIKNFSGWIIGGDVKNVSIKYLGRAFANQPSVRFRIVK